MHIRARAGDSSQIKLMPLFFLFPPSFLVSRELLLLAQLTLEHMSRFIQ